MVFNTSEFFLFFAVVLALYYVLTHRWQNWLLVAASYFFYAQWDWRFCGLLFVSTVVDYYCGLKIPGRKGKLWLWISIVFQLGMLGFFKYYDFFVTEVVAGLRHLGIEPNLPFLNIILPVGISFYTFQTLSYTIDVWRRKIAPERNFINFAAFVSFFPHLVAGPILRASYMLPQIETKRRVTSREISEGTYFILVGLVRKVAVADVIAGAIQPAVQAPQDFSSSQLLLNIYLFSIRIYCDFCGYTDIARGVSLLLGFRLAENFHFPYFATGIQDFWRRWHISLSSWLRDYLYISLGGNRKGPWRTYVNLMLTMVLGGLWHGASWAFVAWGGLHGLYLALGRAFGHRWDAVVEWMRRARLGWLAAAIGMFVTFHLVTFTWIFFVIPEFSVAADYIRGLAALSYTPDQDRLRLLIYSVAVILAIDLPEALTGRHEYLADRGPILRGLAYAAYAALLIVTWTTNYEPFIYFQF